MFIVKVKSEKTIPTVSQTCNPEQILLYFCITLFIYMYTLTCTYTYANISYFMSASIWFI